MNHHSVNVPDDDSDLYQFRLVTGLVGASISSFGYCLMIATALIFPAWRKTRQNQLWLHMCGSYLFYVCLDIYTFVHPIQDRFTSAIVFHINMYVVRVSLFWMFVGAYLTHKNLVVVFFDAHKKFMIKATLFAWLVPLPIEIVIYTIYSFQYSHAIKLGIVADVGCNYFVEEKLRNTFWLIGCLCDNFVTIAPIVLSLCYYVLVAYSLITNRKTMGHTRDLGCTIVLGFFFVFTCCLQCTVISATLILSLEGIWNYITIFLISFHVSTYSVLFIVCNKMTREMWLAFFKKKLLKSDLKPNESLRVQVITVS